MPRATRKKSIRRKSLTLDELMFFLTKKFTFTLQEFDKRAAPLWEYHRDEIIEAWVQVLPGSRPWAWWHYDRPAGTRRGAVVGEHYYDYHPGGVERLSYGLPVYHDNRVPAVVYETEYDFLERLDLLFDCEAGIGEYILRENSCNYFRREDDESVEEVVRLLGFVREGQYDTG